LFFITLPIFLFLSRCLILSSRIVSHIHSQV
jgi:hypothetical protein